MKRRQRTPEAVRLAGRIYRASGKMFVEVKRCLFPFPDERYTARTYVPQSGSRASVYTAEGRTERAALVNLLAEVRRRRQGANEP